nr:filamentous hemagglutinin N-terminal domain-containing protein [Xanthomonas massiliensis]
MGRIVADPSAPRNQRPAVVAAANGTPTVNIATPSAAGVSHNTYSQFDVGAKGAILNNSRTNAQTQLGGWVQGNPWLATGTARVILNEVNSANPSYLNGYVEVAGDRAEVIIANPAGIQVDGGGFLNASRATLTTGKPVFNGGSLDAYRVEGGVIGVSGAGLDASQTDYTGLIARSLQINAGIWAQNLAVTAGSNEVAAAAGTTQLRRPASAAPGFAIDVGQLGGMYAGKITLVGTEHGVGVRNAGAIGAQAGDLVVTVDGRLENTGSLQSQQDTRVVASGGIANAGILSAGRELTVDTSQDLDNSGGTLNAMRVAVDAQSLHNRDGAIEQTGLQALALNSGALSNRDGGRIGEIDAGAGGNPGTSEPAEGGTPGMGNDAGSGSQDGGGSGPGSDDTGDGAGPSVPPVVPLADGALHISGLLDNDGGRISAGGGIDLSTATGLDNAGGQLGVRSLTVAQGDLLNQGGALTVTGAARLDVASFDNDAGTFQANEALSLRAGSLSNREGHIQHGGTEDTRIDIAGTLDNTDGTLATNAGALEIAAGHLVNRGGLIQHAGADGLTLATGRLDGDQGTIATAGALQLAAAGISHREATLSAQQVAIDAASLDNHGGQIVATGSDANRLRVDGELDNSDGSLASNGDLSLEAGRFVNVDGVVQQAGDGVLSIDAAILEGRGGTLASNGSLSIAGETTDLAEGITSAQRIAIATGDLTTAGGQLTATGTDLLRLQVRGTLDNSTGILGTNGALALDAGMLDNRQGRLVAAGTAPSIAQVSGAFDNRDGEFSTGGDTVLRAGALNNAGGSLLAAEQATLQVTVDGRLDNSARGQIAAGGRADTRGRDAGQPRRRDRACRGGNVVRAGRHAPG